MHWIHSYSLYLFDFDGLLVNSEDLHFAAYVEMCRRRGFELTWDFYRFCLAAHFSSTGLRDAIYQEFPDLKANEPTWDVLYAEKKSIYQELIESGKLELLPGVQALLKALEEAGIRRCVATNSTKAQVDAIKKQLPALATIPLWVTREDYQKAKPEPDAYLTAIRLLGNKEDRMIGFEDSIRGVQALKRAGVPPVLICPEIHPQLDEPLLADVPHFVSFEDIPEIAGPVNNQLFTK